MKHPFTAHRCRYGPNGRRRFTDDDEPLGHVHICDGAGYDTLCGKSIPHNGTWFIDHWREVTCPKCLRKRP